MAKTPKSHASSKASDAANDVHEETELDPVETRIADLDQRIAELNARLANASMEAPSFPQVDEQLMEQQNERIIELQRLVGNLGDRLTAVQAVNARDEQFKAAVRSVESAANAVQRGLTDVTRGGGNEHTIGSIIKEKDCGCGPCECVSCECCTFEVWMSHVRVDQMQDSILSPEDLATDSNLLPINTMEIWMFASIDPIYNVGVCIPDASPLSYLPLHKQITDPYGPWVTVNRCIGTATVKKSTPLTVPLSLTAVERETAADRIMPGNRDEWGSTTENVTLNCCYSDYSPVLISVPLTSWGQGGGAITGRFIISKRC